MAREPLYKIGYRLRGMSFEQRCIYIAACQKCEIAGGRRHRELQKMLVRSRTRQIEQDTHQERIRERASRRFQD